MAAPMAPQSVVNWPWKKSRPIPPDRSEWYGKIRKMHPYEPYDNTVLRAVVVQLNVLLTNRNHFDFRDSHVECLPEILFF